MAVSDWFKTDEDKAEELEAATAPMTMRWRCVECNDRKAVMRFMNAFPRERMSDAKVEHVSIGNFGGGIYRVWFFGNAYESGEAK